MGDSTFVPNSTGKLRKVLLCPPAFFDFRPINEITRKVLADGEHADLDAVRREHEGFAQAYRDAGVDVVLMEPDPDLPYMVYARDFGACLAEGALIGSFREPVRQGEDLLYERKLRELGVPIIGRVDRGFFEGGDFWFLDEATIAHGVVARSDWEGVRAAARILEPLGYAVVGVQLPSRNLHLDMAFNIVAPGVAVCARSSCPTSSCGCSRSAGSSWSRWRAKASSSTTATCSASATAACSRSPATRPSTRSSRRSGSRC